MRRKQWVTNGAGSAYHGAFNEPSAKEKAQPKQKAGGGLQGMLGQLTGLVNIASQFRPGGDRNAGIGGLLDMFIPGAGGLFGAITGFFKKPKVDVGKIDPGNMIATFPAFLSLPLNASAASAAFGGRAAVSGPAFDFRVDYAPGIENFVQVKVNQGLTLASQLEVG